MAGRIGRGIGKAAFGIAVGASGISGFFRGALDPQGPGGDVMEDMIGERDIFRESLRAAVVVGATGQQRVNQSQATSYYYGRPVNADMYNTYRNGARRSRGSEVSGSMVFGMRELS